MDRSLPTARALLGSGRDRLNAASQGAIGRGTWRLAALRRGEIPPIKAVAGTEAGNRVEGYWGKHTVPTIGRWTRRGSERQLEQRFEQYPLFREMSGLWGERRGEIVLDYGCGPGNDVVGLLLYSDAAKVTGIDVSLPALQLAAKRLALHRIDPGRVELIHVPESDARMPVRDASIDYFQSQGVIHHATDPELALRELHRVARPGAEGRIMVYNRSSVWFHLYVAYQLMIVAGKYEGLAADDAFGRTTDGDECPIARAYEPTDFAALCERAGFEVEFLGGYISNTEVAALGETWENASSDPRLDTVHREFLQSLTFDSSGLPMTGEHYAGVGGMYRLRRPEGT